MSWWWLLFGPLLVLVLVLLVGDIISFLRVSKYKSQGFVRSYFPVLGQIKLFLPDKSNPKDGLSNFKKGIAPSQDAPGLVMNYAFGRSAVIYLSDPALIKEFLIKETQVSKRFEQQDLKVSFAFFFDGSAQAMDHRMVFSELFRVDVIDSFIGSITKQVIKHLDSVQEQNQNAAEFTTDFEKPHTDLLKCLANAILFGAPENPPRVSDGKDTMVVQAVFDLIKGPAAEAIFNPLNFLFFGYPNKLNLLPSSRRAAKMAKQIHEAIEGEFNRRSQDSSYKTGVNTLDLMLNHNKKAAGVHKFSMSDIVGDMVLFLFAGSDSTSKTLSACVYFLAKHPDVAEKLYQELQSKGLTTQSAKPLTVDAINELVYLEAVLKECMRLAAIAPASFDKIITEDFSLGQYKFYRGDKIVLPYVFHFSSEKYFPEAQKFDPERFLGARAKSFPQMAYIPFSSGRRGCLGRNLAETIIKVSLIETLKRFKLRLTPDKETNGWTLGMGGLNQEHCTVVCTVRQ